jgi:Tfp pilus assembly protein PilE
MGNNSHKKTIGEKYGAGFTLIELIVVLFFAGILIAVLFNLYDWHGKVYSYQQALVRVSTSNRQTIATMQAYTSQANRLLSSASVNGTTYTTASGTLVMQLPTIDAGNNIVSSKWDKAAFYASGSNFYLQFEPDPSSSRKKLNKILNDSLSSVVFTYNNASTSLVTKVSVTLQSSLTLKQQVVTGSLVQDMYLLNY